MPTWRCSGPRWAAVGLRCVAEPHLAAKPDYRVVLGSRCKQSLQCTDQAVGVLACERKAPRHADESVRRRTAAHCVPDQGAEVREVPGDDRPPLLGRRHEQRTVSETLQLPSLADCDCIMTTTAQLLCDLWR